MLGKQDGKRDFFDSYVEQRLLPKEHELLDINARVDFSFVEEEVADLYCAGTGRPSYPPEQVFRILFLEYYYNLSDVEVVCQLRFNILFRHFVGLSLDDAVPDDSSLSVFRSRLGEERFRGLFQRLIGQCRQEGLLGDRLKLIDATHIVAEVAIPNMIRLLRDGRERVLNRLEARHGQLPELDAVVVKGERQGELTRDSVSLRSFSSSSEPLP
jgi:transposase